MGLTSKPSVQSDCPVRDASEMTRDLRDAPSQTRGD